MSRARRIIKNVFVLVVQYLLLMAVNIFFMGFNGRRLGVDDFGAFNFSLSFAMMFAVVGDLGVRAYIYREVAQDRSRTAKGLGDALVLRGGLALIYGAFMVLLIEVQGLEGSTRLAAYIAVLSQALLSIHTTFAMVFEAHERMEFLSLSNVTSRLAVVAASVAVLLMGQGLLAVCLVHAAGNLLQILVNLALCSRHFAWPAFAAGAGQLWRTLKAARHYALLGIVGPIYLLIDTWMLLHMQGEQAVGLYSPAYRIVYMFDFIPDAVATAVYPALMASWVSSRRDFVTLLAGAMRVVLLVGLPIAIALAFLAPQAIDLIFRDPAYAPSARTLAVMIWYVPLQFANKITSYALGARRLERITTYALAGCTLLNVGLNWVLIPLYSHLGAALATIACEVVLLLVFLTANRRELAEGLGQLRLSRVMLANGALAVVLWAVSHQHLAVMIVLGGGAYLAAALGLRCLSPRELKDMVRPSQA